MFDTMNQAKAPRTTIGVIVEGDLKRQLARIAKKEHRSLSKQAEFFLRRSVEQTTQPDEQGA